VDAVLCVSGGWAGGNAASKGIPHLNTFTSLSYYLHLSILTLTLQLAHSYFHRMNTQMI